tara:strand:- start:5457 stop:5633 length:177 start_codon:yes stop_codon:yes gene_type:complete
MSNLITIKMTEDKTGEVVQEFSGLSERKADKVYSGLLRQMNQSDFTMHWIEESEQLND